jgi:hypothetical protein
VPLTVFREVGCVPSPMPLRVTEGTGTSAERERLQAAQACLLLLEQHRRLTRLPHPMPISGLNGPRDPDGRIGRFVLIHLLGAGGFGIVYLADDPQLGRRVAVKIPRPETLLTAGARARFLCEARAAARLDHPHIVPVFESGEEGLYCY